MKRRPHPLPHVGVVAEVAGREIGKDLGQSLFVLVGQGAIVEEVKVTLIVRVPLTRALRPGVLLGAVVQDQVDADADPTLAEELADRLEVADGAELGIDVAIVGDGVTAVVLALARLEARHQVDVAHPQLLEVAEVPLDPLERPCKAFDVEDVADHTLTLEPVGRQVALEVEELEIVRAFAVPLGKDACQAAHERLEVVPVGVERRETVVEGLEVALEPEREKLLVAFGDTLQRFGGDIEDQLEIVARLGRQKEDVLHPYGYTKELEASIQESASTLNCPIS